VREEELVVLQDCRYLPQGRYAYPRTKDLLTLNEAYHSLLRGLMKPMDERQRVAYSRLRSAWKIRTRDTTPDLYIKIFNDLDTLLFSGKLRRRVLISWTNLSYDNIISKSGQLKEETLGLTSYQANDRVHVKFHKGLFVEESKRTCWGVLLHECIHSYIGVMARERVQRHGQRFRKVAEAIAEVLKLDGLEKRHVVGR
jgi:hypothetical protein